MICHRFIVVTLRLLFLIWSIGWWHSLAPLCVAVLTSFQKSTFQQKLRQENITTFHIQNFIFAAKSCFIAYRFLNVMALVLLLYYTLLQTHQTQLKLLQKETLIFAHMLSAILCQQVLIYIALFGQSSPSEFSVPPKSSNSPSEIHCTMCQSTSEYFVIQNFASICFKFKQESLIFVDELKQIWRHTNRVQ